MKNIKARNSSIELLRIIAIILIIFSHFCFNCGTNILNVNSFVNKSILEIFFLGNLGTAIFFVISGFYLYKSEFKLNRIIRLILITTFYSLVIYLVLMFSGFVDFSIFTLLKSSFPIIFELYWFITVYSIIYLMSPFINKLINSINRREFLSLLLLLLTVWSIIPTFTTYSLFGEPFGRSLIPYLFGIYLSKYKDNIFSKGNNSLYFSILLVLLIIIFPVIMNLLSIINPIFNHGTMLTLPQSFINVLLSVSLFSLFFKMNFSNKFIDLISKSVFGVYLIHNNPFLNDVLWHDLLKIDLFIESNIMFVYMVCSCLSIFIICSLIDIIREFIEKKFIINYINNISNLLEKKYNFFIKKLSGGNFDE